MQVSNETNIAKAIYDSFGRVFLQVDANGKGNDILSMPNITVKGRSMRAWILNNARLAREEFIANEKVLEKERQQFVNRMEGMSHIFMATWLRTNNIDLIHNYGNRIVKEVKAIPTPSEEILNAY